MSKNKKQQAAFLFSEWEKVFACPLCTSPMNVVHDSSLICTNQHCFDLSRQGYVNLLPHPAKTKYAKEMFASRKLISKGGFFDPLLSQLSEVILQTSQPGTQSIRILDAGCGEGSHLSQIQRTIADQTSNGILGVGIDVSKEAIALATSEPSRSIWCVADLANCPFADKQFTAILNILSPANYAEFLRLLADDGIVLKVVPEKEYLRELREFLYAESEQQDYSNDDTTTLFRHHFELVETKRVQYKTAIEPSNLPHLVQMTPLSWGAPQQKVEQLLNLNLAEISVDFSILIGRKKSG